MRIAYLDCTAGISGTMALAALLDAGADTDVVRETLRPVGTFHLDVQGVHAGGMPALRAVVRAEGPEPRRGYRDVLATVHAADLGEAACALTLEVYRRLGEAEALVHDTTPDAVTFHEVGSLRSIIGVVGTAIALDLLGVERVVASRVGTGHGTVRTEHGLLPNPAPATLELLRGIPLEPRDVEAELVTPTGAAILAAAADAFGSEPSMREVAVGLGAGPHDLAFPNVLRVTLGEARG